MTKAFGFALLTLLFSLPAHAQNFGGTESFGSMGEGGAGLGAANFPTLPSIPRAQFQMIDVTGTGQYIPSSWVTFEEGVAQGRAELAANPKTLAEVAADYHRRHRERATLAIVQDAHGNAIIARER